MNTKKAAEVMTLIAEQYAKRRQMPNWKELGSLVTKRVEKHPSASVEALAEDALKAYKNA